MTLAGPSELHEARKSHHQVIKCNNDAVLAPQCNTNHKTIFHSRQVSRCVDRSVLLATWQLQSLGTKNASKLGCSNSKYPTHHWTPDIKEIDDYWDGGRGIETLGCVCLSLHRSARMFVSIT